MATAKHFPGHGDTHVDSHLDLPVIGASRERLEAVELVPFRRAVLAGVDAVMSAHVALPRIVGEGEPPATLHPYFLDRLLRGDMGFRGLVVTDALTMAAIAGGEWPDPPAVMALRAGADILLSPPDVAAAVDAVVSAVEEGRLDEERVRASARRVLEAKARAGLHLDRFVDLDAVDEVVGAREHVAFADTAAARSITLARDAEGWVPLDPRARLLSVTFARPVDAVAGRTFDRELRGLQQGGTVVSLRVAPASRPADWQALGEALAGADAVVVGAHLGASEGTGEDALPAELRAFVRLAQARHPTVLVSFGSPYLLGAFPAVSSYLLAWSGREVMERAAARALLGAEAISGRLPIALPPHHERGEGLDRPVRDLAAAAAAVVAATPREDEPPPEGVAPAAAVAGVADSVRRADGPDRFLWGFPTTVSFLEADPASVGMSADRLAAVDSLLLRAVSGGVTPGAALAVGRRGRLVRLRGYGWLDHDRERQASPATIYDLASLTKVVGTTTAIMLLEQEGRLDLDRPVVAYLPGWDRGDAGKGGVTLRHLLLHTGGLAPFRRWFFDLSGKEAYREAIYDEPLEAEPGSRTAYSDIGAMTLGLVVEAVTGTTLDRFLEERVWGPLGMDDTGFLPDPSVLPRVAPTEVDTAWRKVHVRGVVHDENADAMGGVAGHAGLFSTAFDLAVFADLLLRGGVAPPCVPDVGSGVPCAGERGDSIRLLRPELVARYTARAAPGSSRALGWDTPEGRSSAGDYLSGRSFGHTGFTGTSIWIDPELELFVVLLTNRVNPTREQSGHVPLRRAVHDEVARAITDRRVRRREPVR